ncbi:LOW QUALITY PROTEIN: hypothetical protein KUTeg_024279 [Tegillarca granosa]|uniref:Mitochondria-eating protein C-terminal domain-containing protein n=1 Tax=Tegillarca granosa TaxID=220873 RepID=A0ABQ9E377_TEGGR|nr:LOW QUALITY PROTEIN: hypothetical protein KUTeg_024279 [Tegillarca granosa]
MFNEIYDNVWTDTLEGLNQPKQIATEKKAVEHMASILKDEAIKFVQDTKLRKDMETYKGKTEKFTKQCLEICWLMVVQDPKVVLYWGDVKEGSKINSDHFKCFTRSGKLLEYLVWPAMLLHKDGPFLSKGIESDGENLFDKVNNVIVNELKIDPVKFDRIHMIGPKSIKYTQVGKCFDYSQKEKVLQQAKLLKSGVKIYSKFPESQRENQKRATDLQKRFSEENAHTKVVGDRLIFKPSGSAYEEEICIPKADNILTSPN